MIIINATQHQATIEQTYDGVIDLSKSMREQIQMLLNFDQLPTAVDVVFRARKIALLIEIETDFIGAGKGEKFAMIGGAPFLMGPLCQALKDRGITPVFAFSQRESPVLKEFLVRWAATVKSDSPKSAVRRVWGTHFKSTDHDAFTVYYASGKKKNHFRANVLAPETSRCLQEDKVFNVSWEAKVYAGNSDEALYTYFAEEEPPQMGL